VHRETLVPLARAALQNLEANRQRIDDLNVYPVPDGDTGTNLVLTLRSIVEALDASSAQGSEAVAKELSRAALMGARGDSGVIFSQIVRGFAKELGEAGDVTSESLARAFRAGSDAAYRAVSHVGAVEGTILTVAREMAEQAESDAPAGLEPLMLLDAVLARGEDALARTPELLDVLGQAGVVDAGGAGLVEIVRGTVLAAHGKPIPSAPVEVETLGSDAIHQELSKYRYCTGFVVEGADLDPVAFEDALGRLGDSLLVVGDETALKVHVHTDDPGAALSAATAIGVLDEVEIADMYAQTAAREARLTGTDPAEVMLALTPLKTGVVAVAQGDGNRAMFASERATVVEGGQTTNPTVEELLEAIEATPADGVIVLPNNSNVVLAASEAAKLSEKDVRVLPALSIQAGISALERFSADAELDDNESRMREKLAAIATGEVTVASRDASLDGVEIRDGEFLGLVEGAAVASGDALDDVALDVVLRVAEGRELLLILTGEPPPVLDGLLDSVAQARPDLECEVLAGGQPHYPLLVVAE
jgi:DAK2 domain fusion protein YloV